MCDHYIYIYTYYMGGRARTASNRMYDFREARTLCMIYMWYTRFDVYMRSRECMCECVSLYSMAMFEECDNLVWFYLFTEYITIYLVGSRVERFFGNGFKATHAFIYKLLKYLHNDLNSIIIVEENKHFLLDTLNSIVFPVIFGGYLNTSNHADDISDECSG